MGDRLRIRKRARSSQPPTGSIRLCAEGSQLRCRGGEHGRVGSVGGKVKGTRELSKEGRSWRD